MSEPGQKSEQAVQANMGYAISLLNEGTFPEVVQAKLVCKPAETKHKDGMYQIDKLYPGINHGGYVF
jgi:hypothetical protein